MTFQTPGRIAHPADVYHRAWELLESRSPQQAIEILDPAIETEPTSTSLRTLRAWAYFQSAQLSKAEEDLSTLVDECPTDVWARFALARALWRCLHERILTLPDDLPVYPTHGAGSSTRHARIAISSKGGTLSGRRGAVACSCGKRGPPSRNPNATLCAANCSVMIGWNKT